MDAELRIHMRAMRFHSVVGNDERFLNVSRIAPAGQKAENLALAFRQMGVFRKLEQPVLKSLFAAFALDNTHLRRRRNLLDRFREPELPNNEQHVRHKNKHDARRNNGKQHPVVLARTIRHAAEQSAEYRPPRGHGISPGERRQRANGVARPNLNQNVIHKNLEHARARRKQRTRHGVARGASHGKGQKARNRKKKRYAEKPVGRKGAPARDREKRNEEMLETLQPQTLNKYSLSIAIDGTTGDGIKACLWAGAHMDEVHTAMVFDRVAVKPDELGGSETTGSPFWMGSNPWLKVNLNGERFTNEAAPYDYILNSTLTQPGHTVVDIWDSDYEKYLEQFDIHGCARVFPFDNGAPTNMTLEATKGINEGLIQDGYIVVADTIEELAEGLGLPAEALKKTVERQNENYDAGVDPDFGKDVHRLSAIRTAPFYGVRTSGYMLCTLDGITINENFQAVDDNGKAIEGLYVTGVDSGSYYAHTYPNMSTGNCCGRSVTFGRMIGKALAAK